MWSLHHDQDHWGDPEVFRPERFINNDGVLKSDDWVMPFGLGKKKCLIFLIPVIIYFLAQCKFKKVNLYLSINCKDAAISFVPPTNNKKLCIISLLKKHVITGRRRCLGETLAKSYMFMLVGAVLQRFTFSTPTMTDLPASIPGIIASCPKYQLVLKPRCG